MRKLNFIIPLTLLGINATAQEAAKPAEPEKPSVKLSGYVRAESFFDTYRSNDNRDGETYMYPLRENLDSSGNDINKLNQLQLLGLQSRVRVNVTGGTAFGAKTSGLIEADFMGNTDANKYVLRLRNAMVKLDWENSQLLVGQWWHLVCMSEFSPSTVAFGSGVPFNSLNRSPQIRYTYKALDQLKLIGAVHSYALQRPKEPSGINSQRVSGLPDAQFQIQYGNPKEALFASVTAGYKWVKPYLSYKDTVGSPDKVIKSTKNVGSYNFQASLGYQLPFLSIKTQCNYGENLTFLSMIGGYSPVRNTLDIGEPDYDNMKTIAVWADIETKGESVRAGLFAGYSENLGTSKDVVQSSDLVTGTDLRKIMRIAPRVYIINGPVDLGIEYTLTTATYGTFNGKKVDNLLDPTINNRIQVSLRYTY
jgi:hypothetical protein